MMASWCVPLLTYFDFDTCSAKAADCWALGVCLYMWLYLRPPFEAPTLYMLLEEIRQKQPPIDTAVVVGEELMALLLGLLARKPTQRLRVKDLRRNELLTRCGEMPPSSAMTQGQLAKEELRSAISLVVVTLRAQAVLSAPLRADTGEDTPTETGSELVEHGTIAQEAAKVTDPSEVSLIPGKLGSGEYLNALDC